MAINTIRKLTAGEMAWLRRRAMSGGRLNGGQVHALAAESARGAPERLLGEGYSGGIVRDIWRRQSLRTPPETGYYARPGETVRVTQPARYLVLGAYDEEGFDSPYRSQLRADPDRSRLKALSTRQDYGGGRHKTDDLWNPSAKPRKLRGSRRIIENKDGTRTVYSSSGFRVIGGATPSPNATTTVKNPLGDSHGWKKGFFANGTPAGATFTSMDAGGMRYGKDGKPLAVTTKHWSAAKNVRDAPDRLSESREDIKTSIDGMRSLGAGMVSDPGGQSSAQVIDALRGVRSASEKAVSDARNVGDAIERSETDKALGAAFGDWKVDSKSVSAALGAFDDKTASRNVSLAVDNLVEGMRQGINRQFEADRPPKAMRLGNGAVRRTRDVQDVSNEVADSAFGNQFKSGFSRSSVAKTNDAIDAATQAARDETEASRQRAAETRARTAQFRQERAAKNAADEEFLRQMRARLGQADWDGGMSSRARRFIESRRAEVSEALGRFRTQAAYGGGVSIDEATAQKRKEMVQATAERQHEALMKFGDRNHRARMERLFNAALDGDARDAAMLDEHDRLAEANRARVAKSGLARYDELTAKGRERYAGGRWEKLMNEHTSPAWVMPAEPVAVPREAPRQGFVARAKEAFGVAKDLAGLVADGTKRAYDMDEVHRGAAALARPAATSGIKEVDGSLRRIPAVVNGKIDEGGKVRRMTDADRRDASSQLSAIGLREAANGGRAVKRRILAGGR